MAEKRQLSEPEKEQLLQQHGRKCFVDGEPIGEEEAVEYHHIKPFSEEGPTTLDNIAPVCKRHHLTIGTMSLQEYRDKLELERFFEDGEPKYLDDLIRYKRGRYGEGFKHETTAGMITLFFGDSRHEYSLHTCPTTGWGYFYGTVPVEYVENDPDLQPRPLRQASLWGLYRHFQTSTQISPSFSCLTDNTKPQRKFGPVVG